MCLQFEMLALPFPSSPSVMLMVPAMLVWCCMESRRLLVLLSSKHNIHEHDDSAVHWPINPDSTLRSKTEKRLLLLQPTISLSKRQMPAPSAVEKFGALWKWDYWGAPLLPRRTACCCPTAIPILLSSTRVQPCAEDRLVHNREFFASNNKTELFSQCTPHPRPGVIVLICMKKLRK